MLQIPALLYVAMTACLFGPPDEPPRPTFDKKIDYIAWYNDFVRGGRTKNALDAYASLYDEKGTGKPALKAPEGKAAEQFEAAFGHVWDPEKNAELVQFLTAQEPYLQIATKAAAGRDLWMPCPPDKVVLMQMLLPVLSISRQACKDFIVLSWMKQENQGQAVLDAWQFSLRSAGQMQQGGVLISLLVGLAERALAYRDIRSALAADVLTEQDLAAALELVRTADPHRPNMRGAITAEWAVMMDTLQYVCPQGKPDPKRLGPLAQLTDPANAGEVRAANFDPRETAARLEVYFRDLLKDIRNTPTRSALHAVREFYKRQAPKNADNAFLKLFIPSLSRSFELVLRAEVERRATLLLLAIHQHRAKHGHWPAKLDDLKLPDLAAVRIDPYSDADFHYALVDGAPRLYTVGFDEKDDGGRHDPKWGENGGDYVFWPQPSAAKK